MRCDRNTVHSWVNWARQDGVLIQTKRHAFRSQGTSKAAEYVMGIHQWPTALPTLAALLRLPVRQEDVDWVAEQFAAAREAS